MLHDAGDALASVMLAAVCFVSRSSEGSLCYVLTSFSHSLICLESWKTDPLSVKAQSFPDKLAGSSPQGKGEQAGEGEAEVPLLASAQSQASPSQTPATPAQMINQQQEACGHAFVAELALTSGLQFNGKYSLMEVNFGGLLKSGDLSQQDQLAILDRG